LGRGRGLRRAPPKRTPMARFPIYCERENTEPHYFRELLALHDHAVLIEIASIPGDLLRLATEAAERALAGRHRKAPAAQFL
jgi:hypothetical protein